MKIEVKFTVADTLDGLVMGHPVECRHFCLNFFFNLILIKISEYRADIKKYMQHSI